MDKDHEEWELRVAELWKRVESLQASDLVTAVDELANERDQGNAAALFERACV
jgi:hypothetical protein